MNPQLSLFTNRDSIVGYGEIYLLRTYRGVHTTKNRVRGTGMKLYLRNMIGFYSFQFRDWFSCTIQAKGVKLYFTGGHISLAVAFKGLNVILGLYKCNYSLILDDNIILIFLYISYFLFQYLKYSQMEYYIHWHLHGRGTKQSIQVFHNYRLIYL